MSKPLPISVVFNNHDEWDEAARAALNGFIERGVSFTADDLRDVTPVPKHANWVGPLFGEFQAKGLIRYVGHERSRSASRRGGALARWVGVKHRDR